MIRFAIPVLVAATGLVLAQDQPPVPPQQQTAPGGWRRVGDPPPPPQTDPSEPVDRSDQPQYPPQLPQSQIPAQGQMPQAMPQQQSNPPASSRPAYGLPPEVTVRPGTFVTIRTNSLLSTDRNQTGDSWTGTLAQALVVDGVVIAQRGQAVYGRVDQAIKQSSGKPAKLGLELTGITLADGTQVDVHSQLVARQGGQTPGGMEAGTIIGTTGLGAAVGAAADWGRGAAIGAGVGAAAGIIGVILTHNHASVVYPETPLTFRMEQPVTVSTVRAPQAFRFVGPEDYQRGYNAQGPPRPAGPGPYPSPYSSGPYSYGPGYYPYYYPYSYGPSVGIYWGPGFVYGRYYGRRW